LFKDLRALLEVKRRSLMQGGDGLVGYQDTQARGFDRFVVRDWEISSWTLSWK
jgi:hypothetical protein